MGKEIADNEAVYPGDSLTSIFALDSDLDEWPDIWFLEPGDAGSEAGVNPLSKALSFQMRKFSTCLFIYRVLHSVGYWPMAV